jgi:S1-C subfamily serine protease
MTQYMGQEIKLTNGIISSHSGYQGDISTYQITAPVQPGNSGGPLFDYNGNIVGIINAGIPSADNVGYAIKTSYLKNLVESSVKENIIPYRNSISTNTLANKVQSLKNFVFLIKCH